MLSSIRRATHPATVLILAGAAVALLASLTASRVTSKMPDLEVYWRAAVRAEAGEPLYRLEDGHYQFKYLPAFAVLAAPLATMSLAQAKTTWFAMNIVLLIALLVLSIRLLPERRRPAWLLALVLVLALGKFLAHEIVLGQANLLFGAVALAGLAALNRGREAAGGALVVAAIVVKPYAVAFLPWLGMRRRRASIAAAAVAFAGVLLLPAVRYGFTGDVQLHREWWRTVTDSTAPNLTNADNISIAGMSAKWLGQEMPAARVLTAAVAVLLVAGAVLLVVHRRRVERPDALEVAYLLTCIPLLSPQGWDYVLLISAPAIACLANYGDALPRALGVSVAIAVGVAGLTLYDVMGSAMYAAFMRASLVTPCYLLVLAALLAVRRRAVA